MVSLFPKTPEPLEQKTPAPARLLLRREKGRPLKARLEQIDEDGGAYDIVELAAIIAIVNGKAVAESDRCAGMKMLKALRLEYEIVAVLANEAVIDEAASNGLIDGMTLQLPTTGYHTTQETASIASTAVYIELLRSLAEAN